MKSNKQGSILANQKRNGFTLIELLVVVAIISLLTSVALIAMQNARQKSRDAKRLSDMTQMANAFDLYFATYKGYPSDTATLRASGLIMTTPLAPQPADGNCAVTPDDHGTNMTDYFYYPSGTSYVLSVNGQSTTLYPGYEMSFCLGNPTGNFPAGVHYVTPTGIK